MLRVGIVGLGGWALRHHRAFLELEHSREAKVIAACDPRIADLKELADELALAERGVRIWPDFQEMMSACADSLDVVIVAAPIHLHASMHAACVRAGLACYLEKPPTLDPAEFSEMVEAEKKAARPTYVSFNFVYEPLRRGLKRRIAAGEFGALKTVSFVGLTRRPAEYFARNKWAGRLVLNGNLLLDSCCGNAMAHFVNGALFLAGNSAVNSWAHIVEMEAELYRANDIEGADTVFASGQLHNGATLRIAASHACEDAAFFEERFEFDLATIVIRDGSEVTLSFLDGRVERLTIPPISLLENLRHYFAVLRGEIERPAVLLSDCEAFVEANALLYVAAKSIHPLSMPSNIIPRLRETSLRFAETGLFPSRAGLDWGKPGDSARRGEIGDLRRTIDAIVSRQG